MSGNPDVRDPAGVEAVNSTSPRRADLDQLEVAYLMHRQECHSCTCGRPCAMARRLEEARRVPEAAS
ncbi:hypothetical protein FM076_07970 [Streptomyces albus subsp. chlorinus]|uniref:hypothetical protein n=1 Tax=Streptomyces albus TaxID=1888 RepID=UPI00157049BC|nr:hypothetical protein [Streptomyces albus]NSC21149.1 hypothetical protein [Streptomyces albus subsp. chlorinus]